jgi:hypothetical protein
VRGVDLAPSSRTTINALETGFSVAIKSDTKLKSTIG